MPCFDYAASLREYTDCGMIDGLQQTLQRSLFEASREFLGGDLVLEVSGQDPVVVGPQGVKVRASVA